MFLSLRQQNQWNENLISAGHGEAFDKKYQRHDFAAVKRKTFQKGIVCFIAKLRKIKDELL
jgi:hypothetical protein